MFASYIFVPIQVGSTAGVLTQLTKIKGAYVLWIRNLVAYNSKTQVEILIITFFIKYYTLYRYISLQFRILCALLVIQGFFTTILGSAQQRMNKIILMVISYCSSAHNVLYKVSIRTCW